MSIRTKILGWVDVLMRVPSLFVIDEILKINMGFPTDISYTHSELTFDENDDIIPPLLNNTIINSSILNNTEEIDKLGNDNELSVNRIFFMFMLETFIRLLGCLSASCIFLLWTRHLVIVYMFVISVGLIFLSYWSNVSALLLIENDSSILEDILSLNTSRVLDPNGVICAILPHLLAQWLMGMLFTYIHLGPRNSRIQKILPVCFMMPLLLAMLPLPTSMIKHSPAFSAILPLILTKIALWNNSWYVGKIVYLGYQYGKSFATNFGVSALVENEWQRLNVPCVLRVFWAIRVFQQLLTVFITSNMPLNILRTGQNLLIRGCETLPAVLGMTSIVSIFCHYIGKFVQFFLLSEEYNDEDKSIGTVSAILFYILALQTGLTSLDPEKRVIRLCRNLCRLITALFHFIHNIVSPLLMSLSAARNPSKKRHARALIVCALLMIGPIALLDVLWSRHSASTWLLAVTAFSVEAIVRVLVSLATYTLFLLDAKRDTFWEKLDDYVYYIRAVGNSVEFCFGIFLFLNGAWILAFESGGAIRSLMMCIHAYFNIWLEARAGWSVFMKRRTAVHKISSLPEATSAEIQAFNDVCAICYQDMESAKITRCRHFFHGVCLRKWLYVQDRCPLCHEIMMVKEETQLETREISVQPINLNESQNVPESSRSSSVESVPIQDVQGTSEY